MNAGARLGALAAWSRRHAAILAIVTVAVAVTWGFAAGVLMRTRPFGLPLDDAYIYLTYAKQFGRGEPFSYFSGGGYSAGSTSALWPMLLAPFWALGARGHALVWVSFALCAALYAATCVAGYRLARELAGGVAGLVAAALIVASAPFAWCALAGMEVAFASSLLVATLILLARAPAAGPPPRVLALCLAATSLSRPEAMMLVVVIAGVAAAQRARRRELAAAAWWLAPLAAPAAWLIANKLLAGNWMPNTGVAKSHFYLPGFDWTYWWNAVGRQTGRLFTQLFWDAGSPLIWGPAAAILWLAGATCVVVWARQRRRWLAGALILGAPFAVMLAVIASSGAWSFQNYRYIAPALPLVMITAGCAFGAPWLARRVWLARGAAIATIAAFWWGALPALGADIALYAQNAADLNRQVVTLGHYLHRKLPDASILFHDAGAVAYYGDTRVYDMLGLVTNRQAGVANHGPGARFEFLERVADLPVEQRPTHFVYYPGWLGQNEFFGETLLGTPLAPAFSRRRLVGDHDMQLITAVWDHAHTAERPLEPIAGWRIADRVDVADLTDEHAHRWSGALGRRRFGDPTARWSLVHRELRASGLVLDGGRTIRGDRETFTLAVEPGAPVRLVLRTGGMPSYPWHEEITAPVTLQITAAGATAEATIPPPSGALVEIAVALPASRARELTVEVAATGPYRVFHWFALQPE